MLLPHPLSFSLLENVLLKSKSIFGNGAVYLRFKYICGSNLDQVYVTRRENWKALILMTTRMEVDRKCSSNPYFLILLLRSGKMDFFDFLLLCVRHAWWRSRLAKCRYFPRQRAAGRNQMMGRTHQLTLLCMCLCARVTGYV